MQSSLKSDNTLGGVTILVNHISSWVLQPEVDNSWFLVFLQIFHTYMLQINKLYTDNLNKYMWQSCGPWLSCRGGVMQWTQVCICFFYRTLCWCTNSTATSFIAQIVHDHLFSFWHINVQQGQLATLFFWSRFTQQRCNHCKNKTGENALLWWQIKHDLPTCHTAISLMNTKKLQQH